MKAFRTFRNLRTGGHLISDSVKPIVTLLVIIFIWLRYNDLINFFKGLFRYRPNTFKGSIKDLPQNKDYYKQMMLKVVDSINGFSPFNVGLYPLLSLSNDELRYINDIYFNPEYVENTLRKDLKEDVWDNPILFTSLSAKFALADIPF